MDRSKKAAENCRELRPSRPASGNNLWSGPANAPTRMGNKSEDPGKRASESSSAYETANSRME